MDLHQTVRDFVGGIEKEDLVMIQEFPRAKEGWSVERHTGWQCVSHREAHLWRGTGVVFHPDVWSIRKRIHARRGTWFKMKHLQTEEIFWFGTAHFSPGIPVAQYEEQLSGYFGALPKGAHRVVFQGGLSTRVTLKQSPKREKEDWSRQRGTSEAFGCALRSPLRRSFRLADRGRRVVRDKCWISWPPNALGFTSGKSMWTRASALVRIMSSSPGEWGSQPNRSAGGTLLGRESGLAGSPRSTIWIKGLWRSSPSGAPGREKGTRLGTRRR